MVQLFLIDSLHFVNFVSLCSKIFSSGPQSSRRHEIWCQSSIEFDRLRPFFVFHRLFEATFHFSVVKKFARVHQTSREFTRLRASSPDFARVRLTSTSSPSFTLPISFDLHPQKKCSPSWQSWPSSVFSGIFAGSKLANLANFTRSYFVFGRARFHPSHLFRSVSTSQGSVASS